MRQTGNRTVTMLKVISVFAIVLMIFTLVWLKATITTLEYKLSSLDKTRNEALREQKTLVAQKAQLMALTRVEKSDLAGLGFTFPERKRVVYVKGAGEQTPYKVSYNAD
jgi:hypothetical protein